MYDENRTWVFTDKGAVLWIQVLNRLANLEAANQQLAQIVQAQQLQLQSTAR